MRLQLSPAEARQVLDQLDAKPSDDLKHVRARLVDQLSAAGRSKMLDADELKALIWAAGEFIETVQQNPNVPLPARQVAERLKVAGLKLQGMLVRQNQESGT